MFWKKVSFSYGDLRISRLANFKNRSFSSGQEIVQINPNLVWSIPCVGRVLSKKIFCYNLCRNKVSFSYGNLRISRLANFINRSFSSDQEIVQINPNLVWSIPCVGRVLAKKIFCYNLCRKKVSFSYGNLRISRLANFKNRSFSSDQEIVQISPNLVWSIPCVGRVLAKKIFCYNLCRKKVSFSYGSLRISRLANFKNRSFSSGQGVVQFKPNYVWSIPCVG